MERDNPSLASTLPKTLQQHLLQGQSEHASQGETRPQHPPDVPTEYIGSADQPDQPSNSYSQNTQRHAEEPFSSPPLHSRSANYRPQSWHGGDPGPSSIGNASLPPIRNYLLPQHVPPSRRYSSHLMSEPTSPYRHEYAEHEEWDEESNIASATEHDSGSSYSPHRQPRNTLRQSHGELTGDSLYHESNAQRSFTHLALFQPIEPNATEIKPEPSEPSRRIEFQDRPFKKSSSPTFSEQEYDPFEKDKRKVTKRKKTPVACDFCRGRKLRCDGKRPMCGNCEARNSSQCNYEPFIRRRGPGKAPKGSKKKRKEPVNFLESERLSTESSSSVVARPQLQTLQHPSRTEPNVPNPYPTFQEAFPPFEPAAAGFPYRSRHPVDYEGSSLHFVYNLPASGMRTTSGQPGFTNAPPRIGTSSSTLTYPSRQRSSSHLTFPHGFPESISTPLPTSVRYQPQPPFSDGGAYWQNDIATASSSEAALFGRRSGPLPPALPFHTQNEPYFPRQLTSSERDGGSTEHGYVDMEHSGLDPSLNYHAGGLGMGPRFAEGAQGDRTLARLGATAEIHTGPYEEYSISSQQIGLGDSQTNPRTFRPRPNAGQEQQEQPRYGS